MCNLLKIYRFSSYTVVLYFTAVVRNYGKVKETHRCVLRKLSTTKKPEETRRIFGPFSVIAPDAKTLNKPGVGLKSDIGIWRRLLYTCIKITIRSLTKKKKTTECNNERYFKSL